MRITIIATEPQAILLLRDDCGILRSLQAAEGPDPRIKVQDNEAGTLDRSMILKTMALKMPDCNRRGRNGAILDAIKAGGESREDIRKRFKFI